MSVYLVTWDLNKQKANYNQARQNLISHLSRYEHTKDPGLDSVWFISSASSAETLSAEILKHTDDNDRLIVTKLSSGTHQGILLKSVWDWINARI
jgi:hypothetical protein